MSKKNPYFQVGDRAHYHIGDSKHYVRLTEHDHAVILSPKGPECTEDSCIQDISFHSETTESMVLEGYVAIALDASEQPRWDNERAVYKDCWGE